MAFVYIILVDESAFWPIVLKSRSSSLYQKMPEMHTQDLLHFRGPRKRAKMFHSSKFDTFTKKRIGQPAQLSGFLMGKQKIKKLYNYSRKQD